MAFTKIRTNALARVEQEKQMRTLKIGKVSLAAFVFIALIAGCGREQTTIPVPAITATSPANAATGVGVSQAITATFNQPMNATTINATTFTVTGPGVTPVTGTVTFSGSTATFTPNAALLPSTLYTATITMGAKNSTGMGLTANFVWTFTTGTIPAVISMNPLNGAVVVPTN